MSIENALRPRSFTNNNNKNYENKIVSTKILPRLVSYETNNEEILNKTPIFQEVVNEQPTTFFNTDSTKLKGITSFLSNSVQETSKIAHDAIMSAELKRREELINNRRDYLSSKRGGLTTNVCPDGQHYHPENNLADSNGCMNNHDMNV